MRICFLIPSLSGGGAEFVAREWASWFSKRGDEVTVATTLSNTPPPGNVDYRIIKLHGSSILSHSRSLRKLIELQKFDAVVSLLPYYNIMAIFATRYMRDRPQILISGRNVEVPFPEVHGERYWITRKIAQALYPRCDGYIAISHPVAAEACALYAINPSSVFVIPNPATAKVSRILENIPRSVDKAHDRNSDDLNIVIPARIAAQKRPLIALETAKILSRNYNTVTVHFFGVGDLKECVQEHAEKLGVCAIFHGWNEQWFARLPPNSVVLLTSLVEGFGNVLVEAAAVGVPSVVSSRCLGSADAIVPGITGELAMSDSAIEYADAVQRASGIEVTGISKWLSRFTPESSGQAVLSAIRQTQVTIGQRKSGRN